MSLILLDGCEDLSSWTAVSSATVAPGRYQNCTRMAAFNSVSYRLHAAQESDTLTLGFAVKFTVLPTGQVNFVTLRSDNAATDHMKLNINADLSFGLMRGFTTLVTSAPGLVVAGVWYYLEFSSKLHDTTGTATVRLNGVQVLTFSGDTKNAGTKTVYDSYILASGVLTCDIDDLYLSNDATFLGPITVETLYPNGNGDTNAWSGSDGNSTDNYLLVDEVGAPAVSDYVFSSTVGQQDLYQLGNLVHTDGTIVGVCHSAYAAASDVVTSPSIKLLNRRGTTNAGLTFPLGTTAYRSYDYALAADPETAAAWTIANVNSLQSGVELA